MTGKTSTASKATESHANRTRTEATPPGAPGLAGALLDFQSAVGNRSAGRLLGEARLQTKLRESPSRTEEEPAESPEEENPAPEEPASEAPAAEGEPAPALIVDDEAETVGSGQMTKGEFFARLRTEACAAAEAGLAGTPYSARGCPLIEFWVGYYERQSVERINRDLPRFAGEGPRPATAEGYIALITERVRTSVATWARTGKVTGVPPGIPLPGMGLPGLGSLGGLLGGLGGVFFKANPGGARDPGDPRALQARLGAGRPLDGAVRSRMESAFGRSFAQVRVHADSGAAGLAGRLNAKAFTVGEHVAFGAQEYRPGTLTGDALIAHELAHVAQQGDADERFAPLDDRGADYDALERDADRAAAGAVLSLWGRTRMEGQPEPRRRSRLRLSRCNGCNGDSAACRPTIESFDAVKGSEPVVSPWYGQCRLALGTEAGKSGMSFAPQGEVPEGCSGELQFVQLIESCKEKRRPSGESIRRKSSGFMLDTRDPYGMAPLSPSGRVPPGSRIGIHTNDSPGVDPIETPGGPLAFDQISADDKFKMWLLWKPDEPAGAARVPLWMVEWSWKAKATRTGRSGDCATDWTVSGAAAEGGTGKPTDTLPASSGNIKEVPWEPGTCPEG